MNSEVTANDRLVDRIARNPLLDPLCDALAPGLRKMLDSAGPLEPLASTLHGTSGITEWSDTRDDARRLGMAHALLNTVGFGCYVASLGLRIRGNRTAARAIAFAGYAVSSFAAYLGGELSFGMRLGTKHTAYPNVPPDAFAPVLPVADLKDKPVRVEVSGIAMLLSRDNRGQISAVSAICTHRGAALDEGEFADGCVTCPWHHARFVLATGDVVRGPATFPLAHFQTRVSGQMIEVRSAYGT